MREEWGQGNYYLFFLVYRGSTSGRPVSFNNRNPHWYPQGSRSGARLRVFFCLDLLDMLLPGAAGICIFCVVVFSLLQFRRSLLS